MTKLEKKNKSNPMKQPAPRKSKKERLRHQQKLRRAKMNTLSIQRPKE